MMKTVLKIDGMMCGMCEAHICDTISRAIHDFRPAYFQALLFLEVMNWFEGIVIDRLWVGHSKLWIIPGTEDIPFVQTWLEILKKRGILTLIWIVGAAIVAGLVVMIF